jgi:hypothetical protein
MRKTTISRALQQKDKVRMKKSVSEIKNKI